jgi:hypothetical protein
MNLAAKTAFRDWIMAVHSSPAHLQKEMPRALAKQTLLSALREKPQIRAVTSMATASADQTVECQNGRVRCV